jgi:hypothetical protein
MQAMPRSLGSRLMTVRTMKEQEGRLRGSGAAPPQPCGRAVSPLREKPSTLPQRPPAIMKIVVFARPHPSVLVCIVCASRAVVCVQGVGCVGAPPRSLSLLRLRPPPPLPLAYYVSACACKCKCVLCRGRACRVCLVCCRPCVPRLSSAVLLLLRRALSALSRGGRRGRLRLGLGLDRVPCGSVWLCVFVSQCVSALSPVSVSVVPQATASHSSLCMP